MSHAGRRIASTAVAAAAVALPVAAAGSAHAEALPMVGTLPVVGALPVVGGLTNVAAQHLAQTLPIHGLPVAGGLAGQGAAGSPLSGLPTVSGLPMVGGLAGGAVPLAVPAEDPAVNQAANPAAGDGAASSALGRVPVVGSPVGGLSKNVLPFVAGMAGQAAGQGQEAPPLAHSVPMQQPGPDAVPAAGQQQQMTAPAAHQSAVPQSIAHHSAQQHKQVYAGRHKK